MRNLKNPSMFKLKSNVLGDASFSSFDDLSAALSLKIAELKEKPYLDEDGYPTDAALDIISLWNADVDDWFTFIEKLWYFSSHGWNSAIEQDENNPIRQVKRYYISTIGWSGNESIIKAMEQNEVYLWGTTWVSSRRGGHYVFEYPLD